MNNRSFRLGKICSFYRKTISAFYFFSHGTSVKKHQEEVRPLTASSVFTVSLITERNTIIISAKPDKTGTVFFTVAENDIELSGANGTRMMQLRRQYSVLCGNEYQSKRFSEKNFSYYCIINKNCFQYQSHNK